MSAGEVLETVPGLVVSQHSGEGKANQYQPARLQPRSRHRLLDDGRRCAREYADGRACARLCGPQLPDSRARQRRAIQEGAVLRRRGRFLRGWRSEHQLRQPARTPCRRASVRATTDGGDCWRGVTSRRWWLPACGARVEPQRWTLGSAGRLSRRSTACCGYSRGDNRNGFSLTGMGYWANWDSTDQVAERAVSSGLIPRFGHLDPTDGGQNESTEPRR